jgi:hypothetical protein
MGVSPEKPPRARGNLVGPPRVTDPQGVVQIRGCSYGFGTVNARALWPLTSGGECRVPTERLPGSFAQILFLISGAGDLRF